MGCQGCASAVITFKGGIERGIRKYVPEVTDIFDVTDHAAGIDPNTSSRFRTRCSHVFLLVVRLRTGGPIHLLKFGCN